MGAVVGIIAAVVLLVCLVFSGNRGLAQTPPNVSPSKIASPPATTTSERIKSLDRNEVRALLKKLADTPPPKQGKGSFAMCYSSAPLPSRADYICPKCGERTVYEAGDKAPPLEQADWGTVEVVRWKIDVCRRKLKDIQRLAGDAVSLDESQFCRKCAPNATSPKLVLHISYKDKKNRDIENIEPDDLRLLSDFLAKKIETKRNDMESATPLKDDLPRLQELLGVKLNEQ
jgi:hypothetical protein